MKVINYKTTTGPLNDKFCIDRKALANFLTVKGTNGDQERISFKLQIAKCKDECVDPALV